MVSDQPQVLVRNYKARSQEQAAARFRADAEDLAVLGYRPTSQSWAPGSWGCGSFLVALLLAVIIIGILVFIYMLLVKPEGTLTVTYELRLGTSPASSSVPSGGLATDLAGLAELHQRGILTDDEFAAKKKQMLGL